MNAVLATQDHVLAVARQGRMGLVGRLVQAKSLGSGSRKSFRQFSTEAELVRGPRHANCPGQIRRLMVCVT